MASIRRRDGRQQRERAVSDALSFVIVFSIIITSVALVYVVGFSGLSDARDAERLSNAERAFDVLGDNLDDIHQKEAPSRATEIKLADATLEFGDTTGVTVFVENSSAGVPNQFSADVDPIVFSAGTGAKIVYENGAVFREEGSGAVMLREPRTVIGTQSGRSLAILSLVQTRGSGTGAVEGDTTVLIRARHALSEPLIGDMDGDGTPDTVATEYGYANDPDGDSRNEFEVNYTIDTSPQRAEAWSRYLEPKVTDLGGTCQIVEGGSTVACEFETDRLYLPATRIDVSFD